MNPEHPNKAFAQGPEPEACPEDLAKALEAFASMEPSPGWISSLERKVLAQTEKRSLRPSPGPRVSVRAVLGIVGGIAAVFVLAWGLWSLRFLPPGRGPLGSESLAQDSGSPSDQPRIIHSVFPGPKGHDGTTQGAPPPAQIATVEVPIVPRIDWQEIENRIRQTEVLIAQRTVQDEVDRVLAQYPSRPIR